MKSCSKFIYFFHNTQKATENGNRCNTQGKYSKKNSSDSLAVDSLGPGVHLNVTQILAAGLFKYV